MGNPVQAVTDEEGVYLHHRAVLRTDNSYKSAGVSYNPETGTLKHRVSNKPTGSQSRTARMAQFSWDAQLTALSRMWNRK